MHSKTQESTKQESTHHTVRHIRKPKRHRKIQDVAKAHWPWFAGALVLVVAVFILLRHASAKAKEAKKPAPHDVPIATATVKKGDIGVYIDALGTVTPLASVSVTSRVQGQITSVNYHEGQLVRRGDSLIEIDAAPYEAAVMQAEGQLLRDQASLKEARIDLARYRKAYALHAVSKQQFEDQQQVVAQDEGTVRADQGALASAKVNLAYCHIKSPIDGRVGLRLVDAGNMVQANSTTPLVVVTQVKPITVVFSVPEDDLDKIQGELRHGHAMAVEAYDRAEEKKVATGSFLTLDNTIDSSTGTVRVKASFANDDGALFPNQFVNTKLLLHTERGADLLPTAAIQRNAKGPFVYLIQPDNTAKIHTVKLGTTNEENTVVDGLNPGDRIATGGFDKLQEGVKVSVKNPDKPKTEQQ